MLSKSPRFSGLTMPGGRITVNLAPADLRKAGPSYDLPIALGVLAAAAEIPPDTLESALVVGKLGQDASVRHIRGVISVAALARERQFARLYVPAEDAAEAALIPCVDVCRSIVWPTRSTICAASRRSPRKPAPKARRLSTCAPVDGMRDEEGETKSEEGKARS